MMGDVVGRFVRRGEDCDDKWRRFLPSLLVNSSFTVKGSLVLV